MPPILRVQRKEFDLVKEAADRMARRTNSRVEIDEARIEVAEDDDEDTAATHRGDGALSLS